MVGDLEPIYEVSENVGIIQSVRSKVLINFPYIVLKVNRFLLTLC